MEEYRKQLPLRQQANKPMLKYSSTTTGMPYYQVTAPSNGYVVQSRSQPDSGRSQVETNCRVYRGTYSCVPNEGVLSSMFSAHYPIQPQPTVSQQSYASYLYMSGPGAPNGVTPAQILAASIQTSTNVGSKNPYAQPISIQELVPPDSAYKSGMVPLGSTSGSSISSNASSNQSSSNSSVTPTSLQTNSFMRPQSAVTSETSSTGTRTSTTSPSRAVSKKQEANDEGSNSTTASAAAQSTASSRAVRLPRSNSQEFLKTQPVPRPPSAVKQTSHPGSGQGQIGTQPEDDSCNQNRKKNASSTTTHVTKTSSDRSSLPPTPQIVLYKPQNVHATSNARSSPVNHFTDRFARPSTTRENGIHANRCNKPVSSDGDDHSGCNGHLSGSNERSSVTCPASGMLCAGTPELKVRNPNYTPNKPYSEVSNPLLTTAEQAKPSNNSSNAKPQEDRDHNAQSTSRSKSAQTVNTHVTTENMTKKPPLPNKKHETTQGQRNGEVRRMPVTNTVTGTIFYRKASKAEAVIHDLKKRHTAEGTTAKSSRMEKQQASEDEGEETTDNGSLSADDTTNNERLPVDGEENNHYDYGNLDDDEDDDEALDNLDDDICDSDDGSDTYSISTGFSSHRSSASLRVRSAARHLQNISLQDGSHARSHSAKPRPSSSVSRLSAGSDTEIQPALMPSLFPGVPPTINFVLEGEKVETLPWEFRKLLKWRMSPITPNVVKNCIARSGFRATKKNYDWLGYWGKHMKAQGFKAIREYQKINHFPGSFQIGRKDRLWRNLSKMQVHFGKKEFGFFPQTFILPFDMKLLKRAWEEGGNKQKWIIKPPASARGIGIRVISKWNQIPKKRSVIVQRYLSRPYLINESKFDLRIYVYVTSYDPLRIYIYDDGLVRFASCKYSNSMKNINNKFMHLTNYSINKKNADYEANTDENICQGHKWGLKALWGYLKKQGINTTSIWDNIKELVIKTIISSESCVNSMMKANVRRRYCCHELFGFDVMLDENLKPWIIEVNISPSLHSNSKLDVNIKGGMIRDLFNISGFMLPDKNDVTPSGVTAPVDLSRYTPPNPHVIDKRLFPTQMAPDERAKHAYYCQRHLDEFTQQTILDVITPDDLRMLVETTDEDSRRGNFQRVFPSISTHKFLKFLEQPRYYMLLLDQWVQRYHRMEMRGVALLESLCSQGLHLENPTSDPRHQWTPPSSTLPRESRTAGSACNTMHGKSGSLPTLKKRKPLGADSNSSLGGSTPTSSRPPTAHSAGAMPSS